MRSLRLREQESEYHQQALDQVHETLCLVEPVDVTPVTPEHVPDAIDSWTLQQQVEDSPIEQVNRQMTMQVEWLMASQAVDNNGNPWTFESAYKAILEEEEMIAYFEQLEEAQQAAAVQTNS